MDSSHGMDAAAATHTLQRATPRVRRMQITALTLLVISGAVNYVDRATLAIGNSIALLPLGPPSPRLCSP